MCAMSGHLRFITMTSGIMVTNLTIMAFCCFQRVDFAVSLLTISKDREDVMDFLTPIVAEPCSFFVKIPEEDRFLIFLKPFKVNILLSL